MCATKCKAIKGCISINMAFERTPSADPAVCVDPSSVTVIKCVFWGEPITASTATNTGYRRDNFQVVIAGSNGYVLNTVPLDPSPGR